MPEGARLPISDRDEGIAVRFSLYFKLEYDDVRPGRYQIAAVAGAVPSYLVFSRTDFCVFGQRSHQVTLEVVYVDRGNPGVAGFEPDSSEFSRVLVSGYKGVGVNV